MPDHIIQVEGLSKKYMLGATIRHDTLRDLIAGGARSLFSRNPAGDGKAASGPEEFWALRDVSFDVGRGEVVGIIGRNGAGKSTLLKILSRITDPTRGRATIRGRVASLLEVGTGFHPELSGRENIFLNGAILGMSRAEITRKFDEIVAFSETERFLDTPVKRYSSGMYVRLAFAVAAHLEPEILIVDEVLAVGDLQFQKKCMGKMESAGREGRTVLVVSHNMNTVNRLCSRAVLLSEGRVACQGPTPDVVAHYMNAGGSGNTYEARFPDEPEKPHQVLGVSVVDGKGETIGRHIGSGEGFTVRMVFKLAKPLPGGYATVVIRNQYGEIVMLSDSRDVEGAPDFERPGTRAVEVGFPSPLLTPGRYTISPSIAWHPKGSVDARLDAVNIEIVELEGLRSSRVGYIYIPLAWRAI